MYRRASRRRRSLRSRTCAGQGVLLAAGAAGDLLRAAHRQPMHHLGGVIFDHWHNADERASSPLFAGAEQGNGFVDAALPGVGALGGGDVVDVIPLHAVGELAEEDAGLLIDRERGAEVGRDGHLLRSVGDGQGDLNRVSTLQPDGLADGGADADHVLATHHANGVRNGRNSRLRQ